MFAQNTFLLYERLGCEVQAQRLIEGAELLAALEAPHTLAELRQATAESAMATAQTMFARLVRLQPPESR